MSQTPEQDTTPKDLGSEEQVKARRKSLTTERIQELSDIRFIASQASGRRFLQRLIDHCGYAYHADEVVKHRDALELAHFLFEEVMEVDPSLAAVMGLHAHQRKKGQALSYLDSFHPQPPAKEQS